MFELKTFRNEHKLTQKDAADILGITQSNVSQIENGHRTLSDSMRRILIERYGSDEVARYERTGDSINSYGNSTNYGKDNVFTSKELIEVIRLQSEQITRLVKQNENLVILLEKKLANNLHGENTPSQTT